MRLSPEQLQTIVKAAFTEGYSVGLRHGAAHAIGSDGTDPEKAWLASRALASLTKSN